MNRINGTLGGKRADKITDHTLGGLWLKLKVVYNSFDSFNIVMILSL